MEQVLWKTSRNFAEKGSRELGLTRVPTLSAHYNYWGALKKSQSQGHSPDQLKQDLRELAASAEIVYSPQAILIHNQDWQSPGWWKEMWGWRYTQIYFKECRDSNMLYCWWERSGWEGREGLVDCVKPWAVVVRKALEGSPLEGMHYTFNCIMITLTLKNLFNLHFFNYPKSKVASWSISYRRKCI